MKPNLNNNAKALIRTMTNTDVYGNLSAKSYLKLGLKEPIIPKNVYEVNPITNNSENLVSISEEFNSILNSSNPAINTISLNLTGIEATSLSITNLQGQEVQFTIVPEKSELLKLHLSLKEGVYFVSLFNKDILTSTNKLIIK